MAPVGRRRARSTSTPCACCWTATWRWSRCSWPTTRRASSSPSAEVARLVRRRAPRAVLHTDAVQAAAWLDLADAAAAADLITISGHKLGGPQGVGVLAGRGRPALRAILHGGGQERELRSGTHNVAGIVGLGVGDGGGVRPSGPRPARPGAALRDDLADRLRGGLPGRGRDRAPARRERPGTCTCACPASRAKPCWSCSTTPACAPRPARRAPAGPWSPARSCWPWACPRTRPSPACA